MPLTVTAEFDAHDVRDRLREWVRAGRLEPEAEAGVHLLVEDRLAVPPDARAPVRQPGVAMRAGPPEHVTRVLWESATRGPADPPAAYAELAPGTARATVHLSRAAAADFERALRTFVPVVVALLLRRVGWHHVHAATAIDPSGRGWLFAGNSGSGKSTTAALLATRGWQVGTDDFAFLVPGAGETIDVLGRYDPIALREGGHALLRAPGGLALPDRGKTGYTPEELGGRWTPRVTPRLLAFTRLGSTTTSVAPIEPRDVLAELMRWSLTGVVEPDAADAYLGILSRLGRQARSFRLTLGRDIFDDPELLTRLVP